MKVVINGCFGGFSISLAAAQHMAKNGSERARKEIDKHAKEYGGTPKFHGYGYVDGMDGGYERNDPLLVAAVEALGAKADGEYASLRVVEIPDGVEWHIHEYDGSEHVAENHRTWD